MINRQSAVNLLFLLLVCLFSTGCWGFGSAKKTPRPVKPPVKPAAPVTGDEPMLALKTTGSTSPTNATPAATGESVSLEELNKAISRQREAFAKQDKLATNLLEQWRAVMQQRGQSSSGPDPSWDKDLDFATGAIASITTFREQYRQTLSKFRYPISSAALESLKKEARNADDQLYSALEEMKSVSRRWEEKF